MIYLHAACEMIKPYAEYLFTFEREQEEKHTNWKLNFVYRKNTQQKGDNYLTSACWWAQDPPL